MSDLSTIAGKATETVTLGGKTYTLKPYVVGIWAEMRDFVRSLKGDPIKELCERLDSIPAAQHAIWMKAALEAASAPPSDQEVMAFEKSLMGRAFGLWSCLKADHGAEWKTPQQVYDALIKEAETHGEKKLTEILLKIHLGSGEAALGNSDGRNPNPVPAPTPATDSPSTAAGMESTSSLPTSTVGP